MCEVTVFGSATCSEGKWREGKEDGRNNVIILETFYHVVSHDSYAKL